MKWLTVLVWIEVVTYLPVGLLFWWNNQWRLALAQILLAIVQALIYL